MSDDKPHKFTEPFGGAVDEEGDHVDPCGAPGKIDAAPDDVEQDEDMRDREPREERQVHPRHRFSWQEKLEEVGILPKFQQAHLSNNCQWMADREKKQRAYHVVAQFSSPDEDGKFYVEIDGTRYHSVLLSGDFGTGKTWLATAGFKRIYFYLLRRRAEPSSALWRRFYTFIGEVQSTYSPATDETLQGVLTRYQKTDLLLLDELGDLQKEVETNDRRELLGRVIDHRNDSFLPTLITTNLDAGQMKEQFGERTFERIKEMAVLVKLEGDNLRDNPPPTA